MAVGSRAQVFNGTKDRTSGGLRTEDLFRGKDGRIKSKRASKLAKKNNRLVKAGYVTEKGKFGAVRVEDAKSPRRSAHVLLLEVLLLDALLLSVLLLDADVLLRDVLLLDVDRRDVLLDAVKGLPPFNLDFLFF